MTLKDHRRALELCSYCAKLCRHSCPVSNAIGREALIPQAKMHALDMLERNAIGWNPEHAALPYACTGCRLCQQYCRHGNDVAAALWDGRAEAVRRSLAPRAIADYPARDRARRRRLTLALRSRARPEWLHGGARIAYMPGCDAIASSPQDIDDAFSLFECLSAGPVRLIDPELSCGGYPLWAAGARQEARFAAAQLLRELRAVETLVLGCAACTATFRQTLPDEGFHHNVRVLHLSEFLAEQAHRLPIERRRTEVYYHDPCYLGRHLGVYDAPRQLLRRCVDSLREFAHARELAECCGGGGLVPLTYPEAARDQAARRLREPQINGVRVVVTACSGCKRTLASAKTSVEVLDLVNVLAWATRNPPSATRPRGMPSVPTV